MRVKSNKLRVTSCAFRITVLAIAWWALSACLGSPDCFRAEVFCAGLVTDTLGIEDHGVNQDAWAGLQEAKNNGLADQVDFIESIDARDYAKNIAYFAEHGYDVIFTSGIALQDETLQNADLYPDSVFVGLNQPFEESRPNLISVTFPEDQMGFAAGWLAANISKTGIVAGVCETSGIDAMWRYCEGFRAGVKYVDNSVQVLIRYRDDGDREKLFIDEEWGYETGSGLIRRGADVVFAAGGVTGQGALRATTELGVMGLGSERNQAAALGESGLGVASSLYGRSSSEVQAMMRLIKGGKVVGQWIGQIQYIPLNPSFPPNLMEELDLLLEDLASGKIRINIPESR